MPLSFLGLLRRNCNWLLGEYDELGSETALVVVQIHDLTHYLFGMRSDMLDGLVVLKVAIDHPLVLLRA